MREETESYDAGGNDPVSRRTLLMQEKDKC